MATDAEQFESEVTKIWETPGKDGNDVKKYAQDLGATYLSQDPEAEQEHWMTQPGDIPMSLWQFPDGSKCTISRDGNWVKAKS